jgi:hypothetical protein
MPGYIVIMGLVAAILLIVYFTQRGGPWGLTTIIGFIVGIVLAIIRHDWGILVLCISIGVFLGVIIDLLGRLSDKLRGK